MKILGGFPRKGTCEKSMDESKSAKRKLDAANRKYSQHVREHRCKVGVGDEMIAAPAKRIQAVVEATECTDRHRVVQMIRLRLRSGTLTGAKS